MAGRAREPIRTALVLRGMTTDDLAAARKLASEVEGP